MGETKRKKSVFYCNVTIFLEWGKLMKVISPLVKVLRLTDGDQKPSMGFLYAELKKQMRILKWLATIQRLTIALS